LKSYLIGRKLPLNIRVKTEIFLFLVPLLILGTAPVYAKKTQHMNVSLYSATLLAQINLYRQANGLNMLRFEQRLIKLAQQHSREMSQQERVSHNNFEKRMQASGSRICVENVGWNNNDPQKRFDEWQQSLDNNLTFIACR